MISNLTPASELFLSSVDLIQQRLENASRQVSSGKRISTPADAPPDQIGTLLQLRAELQRNQQIVTNLANAKADADTADSTLSSALSLMDRALELASEGTVTTQTAATRQSLADEVASIQSNMTSYSQTTVQGRFVFGQTAAEASRQVEDPAGGAFPSTKTVHEIFNSTTDSENVFKALSDLHDALAANDADAISAAIDPLKQASTHLNSMQAFYGHVQNRIESANDYASSYSSRLKTQISQLEDADIPAAATEMTQANTQLQAAFQMRAKMRQNSLFDYLG
jgi:flagellar hook-associated protein 3 FlgL